MKSAKLVLLLIFALPCLLSAQKTLNGLWTGRLTNDSSQARNDQSFEMALTEYRGKVYGYSYATFIEDDHLYYIVKRVKGKIEDGVCEVTDDELVSTNLGVKMDKKVKRTITFTMNPTDSSWHLSGSWKTNQTRQFYAITGDIALKEEKDQNKSRLYEHLGDLSLQNTVTLTDEPEKPHGQLVPNNDIAKNEKKKEDKPVKKETIAAPKEDITKAEPKKADDKPVKKDVTEPKKEEVAKTQPKKPEDKPVKNEDVAKVDPRPEKKQEEAKPKTEEPKKTQADIAKTETKKPDAKPADKPATEPTKEDKSQKDIAKSQPKEPQTTDTSPNDKPKTLPADRQGINDKPSAAVNVAKRQSKAAEETIYFAADSLVLALYDNGEVDGDTVSVLLNGELLIAKQGLKSTAFKKTIYITPDMNDSLELVLYAENLGKYPPNTGLLIVYDGDQRHLIRFSADFDKNATVRLRRR